MNTNLRTTKRLLLHHSTFLVRYSLFVFANCQLLTANCQDDVLKYAHQIVDTLASPSMHGRGYVMKGDSIAADYIKKEFERFGVKPIGKEFEQRFSFPVNTFPYYTGIFFSCNEKLNFLNQALIPGRDYLIRSNSPTYDLSGEYRVVICDKKTLLSKNNFKKYRRKENSNYIIEIDACDIKEKNKAKTAEQWIINNTKAKCIIIFQDEKLTWEVSQKKGTIPVFEINCKDSIYKANIEVISFNDSSKFIPNYQSQNVIGFIKGTQYPDSFVVFTAHYDHLGMMGKDVYFPGANDNASGCAMLLNFARYYSQHPPKYSIAFMAFGGEEVGLLGSKYYIEHQLFNINQIKFLINFDIVGTGDEGIKVVNATEHKKEFDELVKINEEKKYLPSVQPRGKAHISDHYFFEEAGVKTFYIYTLGGIKAYHDIYDRPETLPLTKFEELYKLVIDFANDLQD